MVNGILNNGELIGGASKMKYILFTMFIFCGLIYGTPPDTVYPIIAMSGYYEGFSDVWSSDITTDTSAFEGIYKLDDACTTKICINMVIGIEGNGLVIQSSKAGSNYYCDRGIMLFKTTAISSSKSCALYLKMLSASQTDGDTLFVVPVTVRCNTDTCGLSMDACVLDSCNFYRCYSTTFSTNVLDYYIGSISLHGKWIRFDIPKKYISYGDTTVFGFVTRRTPMSAPTGTNGYGTAANDDTLGYLLFYTPTGNKDEWGIGKWNSEQWNTGEWSGK